MHHEHFRCKMNIVERAKEFAMAAHNSAQQVRKYTNEPYWVHPAEVAAIVATVPHTDEMLAAAWLHDTVEDTAITNQDIAREFGEEVAKLVGWLTDVSQPGDGNRSHRKQLDREHIANAPAEVHTIKLADLISNTKSIVEHDPEFAKVYLEEKRLLLEVLVKGNLSLRISARSQISEREFLF